MGTHGGPSSEAPPPFVPGPAASVPSPSVGTEPWQMGATVLSASPTPHTAGGNALPVISTAVAEPSKASCLPKSQTC